MRFCTGIVHISSWLCHICGMKFKTSENTCKKLLSVISSHLITPWIYLEPRFWIPTKVYKASLQRSLVPTSIWLGLILSSIFVSPFYSPAQCHGLPAREFCQECSCPCSSLLSTSGFSLWQERRAGSFAGIAWQRTPSRGLAGAAEQ